MTLKKKCNNIFTQSLTLINMSRKTERVDVLCLWACDQPSAKPKAETPVPGKAYPTRRRPAKWSTSGLWTPLPDGDCDQNLKEKLLTPQANKLTDVFTSLIYSRWTIKDLKVSKKGAANRSNLQPDIWQTSTWTEGLALGMVLQLCH